MPVSPTLGFGSGGPGGSRVVTLYSWPPAPPFFVFARFSRLRESYSVYVPSTGTTNPYARPGPRGARATGHDESATHAHGRELHTYSAAVHTTPEVLGRKNHTIFAKGSASLPDDGAEWRLVPIRAVERGGSRSRSPRCRGCSRSRSPRCRGCSRSRSPRCRFELSSGRQRADAHARSQSTHIAHESQALPSLLDAPPSARPASVCHTCLCSAHGRCCLPFACPLGWRALPACSPPAHLTDAPAHSLDPQGAPTPHSRSAGDVVH